MKTRILGAMFAAMLMVSAIGGTALAAKGGDAGANAKATIVHNGHQITVACHAAQKHLNKHDADSIVTDGDLDCDPRLVDPA